MDYDTLFAVTFHKALAHGAAMSLTYAQESASGASPDQRADHKLLQTQLSVGF